jgi:hypothetical protein
MAQHSAHYSTPYLITRSAVRFVFLTTLVAAFIIIPTLMVAGAMALWP